MRGTIENDRSPRKVDLDYAARMDDEEARTRLLDAAEELFYRHGIQAVGMDRIRTASGVPSSACTDSSRRRNPWSPPTWNAATDAG